MDSSMRSVATPFVSVNSAVDSNSPNEPFPVLGTPAVGATPTRTPGARQPSEGAVFDAFQEYRTSDMMLFLKSPSPFCQWTPSTFVDGVYYLCAEQFFAAEKARLFGDTHILQCIMSVSDPSLHKKYGREVSGFAQTLWEQERDDIVLTAEASPYDRIWGIGLLADHPDARRQPRWRGLNLLGNALQKVRQLLRSNAPPPERSSRLSTVSSTPTSPSERGTGDSWMRFSDRSYCTLASKRAGESVFGELTLAHYKKSGAEAFVRDVSASTGNYQLSEPVTSRPYRVDPPVAKQVDAILDQYLAACFIQHSTSPYSSPLVVIPKNPGGVRITVNYRKLNKLCTLSQLRIPRVDDTLDKLLKGKIYSLLYMKSSFHQITVHRDTIPLTASAAPGWFCKVVNEVIKNLRGVASYLDDLIVFAETSTAHVATIRSLLEKFRLHHLILTPPKATIGPTEAEFLGHSISPDGVRPNGDKVAALTNTPMPKDAKQLRALLGGLSYYRKFLPQMAKRVRPLTTLLKKNVRFDFKDSMESALRALLGGLSYYRKFLPQMAKRVRPLTTLLKKNMRFDFTDSMESAVRQLLAELATPPVWCILSGMPSLMGRGPFAFIVTRAAMDLVALLNKSNLMILLGLSFSLVERLCLESARHWTPLDLEAGSIVWCITRLRGYLLGTHFKIFTDHKSLEYLVRVGENNGRVQRWLEFLAAYTFTLEYRKGSANGNADFLSRLPMEATERDCSGRSRLTPTADDEAVYFIRSCGLVCLLALRRVLGWVGYFRLCRALSWVGYGLLLLTSLTFGAMVRVWDSLPRTLLPGFGWCRTCRQPSLVPWVLPSFAIALPWLRPTNSDLLECFP
ncbi:unnamed protein product [Ectocarpus sp. CCAP 1310/34]|nr:unnamed protein product [Ectocarpus sp. CCAP 1310/34]